MSQEDSENESNNLDDPITSDYLHNLMWEEINDPLVARVEAKMEARIKLNCKHKQLAALICAAVTHEGTLIEIMKLAMPN